MNSTNECFPDIFMVFLLVTLSFGQATEVSEEKCLVQAAVQKQFFNDKNLQNLQKPQASTVSLHFAVSLSKPFSFKDFNYHWICHPVFSVEFK